MSAVPKKKLTEAEYLAIERRAEFKSEFWNGEMFAMAGASRSHNELVTNLSGELFARLKGGSCRTYLSDMRLKVSETGLFTYPDLSIVCGSPEFDTQDLDTLLNPRVLIEVLSKSTESYDRGAKFDFYQKLPTLLEYVLVSQDRMKIERFSRQPNGRWEWSKFEGPAGVFSLETVPVSIPLADIYRGIELVEPPLR